MAHIDRRAFIASAVGGVAASAASPLRRSHLSPQGNAPALANLAFRPLPIADIRPQGWLASQAGRNKITVRDDAGNCMNGK